VTVNTDQLLKQDNDRMIERMGEIVNEEINPVNYLSIDPGKANGVCGYDGKFHLLFMLTVQADEIATFVRKFTKIKKCIIEDYKVYPQKAKQHVYSDLLTPRVIGRIEQWTESNGIILVKQMASIKSTGYKWLGQRPLPKSDPKNHQMDAHVHFIYWGVRNGHIKLEELLKR
jgi:hypothetical protein